MTTPSPLSQGLTGYERGADVLRENLKTIPETPGVYRMISAKSDVLYVGKAKNLKRRVTSYTQQNRLPNRLQRMVAQVHNVEIVVTRTESEALLLEANLIQHFEPPFNILLRDDKSYPYILVTRDHDFPQIAKHRGSQKRKGWYFGPFASGAAVTETLNILQRGFMLRNCTDSAFETRTRPCLQYHIKRCTAPCVHKITKEDYAHYVEEACAFLRGENSALQKKLATQMQQASDALDYELAATLRDRIHLLTGIQQRQDIHAKNLKDADIFALIQQEGRTAVQVFFFRNGANYGTRCYFPHHDKAENPADILSAFLSQFYDDKIIPPLILCNIKPDSDDLLAKAFSEKMDQVVTLSVPTRGERKHFVDHAEENAKTSLARHLSESSEQKKLLASLADLFGLSEPPKRIEVYDNSHTGGTYAIGAMIAAGEEGFLKKTYRKFNIKHAETNDDFAMMKEVLTRRFEKQIKEDPERTSTMWPDLLLIDGGAGQIAMATAALEELGLTDIPIVGIAKGPDRNAGKERFFRVGHDPFSLPMNDPTLYYLQRLRDEAHRFAIGTHRARRDKALTVSRLDDIPGIGPSRKKALLSHFGSAKAVAEASLDDLKKAPEISLEIAKKVYDYFHA